MAVSHGPGPHRSGRTPGSLSSVCATPRGLAEHHAAAVRRKADGRTAISKEARLVYAYLIVAFIRQPGSPDQIPKSPANWPYMASIGPKSALKNAVSIDAPLGPNKSAKKLLSA